MAEVLLSFPRVPPSSRAVGRFRRFFLLAKGFFDGREAPLHLFHSGFLTLHGFLRGFVDMVVEHEGRHWVVDWKSNHLGNEIADYACEIVDVAKTFEYTDLYSDVEVASKK